MNWTKVLWWVLTNIPELYGLIKQIVDLLREGAADPTARSRGMVTATLKSPKGKATVNARLDIRH